jgi:hypothetical protein
MKKMLVTMAAAAVVAAPTARAIDGVGLEAHGAYAYAKCFYECKTSPRSTALWQEITTLMVADPFPGINDGLDTLVQLEVSDGNQYAVATSQFQVSPNDIDELNICAMIEQATGTAGVPSAGIVDIAYFLPAGDGDDYVPLPYYYTPVMPWIKNLLGSFSKSAVTRRAVEPFQRPNTVTAIAKTRCQLIDWAPYEDYPYELYEPVRPVMIENTSDANVPR